MEKTWLIYCHTNKINNKKYIGLTHYAKNPDMRWREGKGYLNSHHKIFKAAIQKYGWENFDHEILEENLPSLEIANEKEKYYIKLYHTYVGGSRVLGL